MRAVIYFILFAVSPRISELIKCRRCALVQYVEQCTTMETCDSGEMCYTESVLRSDLSIRFSGGCNSRTICGFSGSAVGKRSDLVMCMRCCDGNDFCNSKLCGIKSNPALLLHSTGGPVTPVTTTAAIQVTTPAGTGTGTTLPQHGQCFFCNEMSGGRVSSPSQCTTLVTCQSNEMCSVEEFDNNGTKSYSFGCQRLNTCRLLTKLAIEDKHRCQDPAMQAAGFCTHQNRQTDTSTCNVCCGDRLCNRDTCEKVLDHLYMLWRNQTLDLYTLTEGHFQPIAG